MYFALKLYSAVSVYSNLFKEFVRSVSTSPEGFRSIYKNKLQRVRTLAN